MNKKLLINFRKHIPELFCIIFITFIIVFAIIGFNARPHDAQDPVQLQKPDMEWISDASPNTTVSLPYTATTNAGESDQIRSTMPDDIEDNFTMCLRADQVNAAIYINGELRYEYNAEQNSFFNKIAPRRYLFIPINKADSGKEIRIAITPGIDKNGTLNVEAIGQKYDIASAFISDNMTDIAIAFIMLIICVICLIAAIILSISYHTFVDMGYLTFMGIFASIWILCNTEISQFFFSNMSVAVSLDYLMLMALPFPFLFFMNSIQKKKYNLVYKIFEFLAMAESVFCIVMQLTHTMDFSQLFFFIAGVFGSSLIMILITLVIDVFKNKNYSYIIVAIGIFAGVMAALIQIGLFIAGLYTIGGTTVAIALLIMLATAVIHTFHNLRALENERQAAIAEGKAESTFLANMSHEIRTPINAVLGMNEMILRETKEEQTREYAENIENSGTMLLSIVNDILDFSKIKSGKMDIIAERYSLVELVANVREMIEPRAVAKNLKYRSAVALDMPNFLYGDEVRIKQIIINLMTNAVKYTEKGFAALTINSTPIDETHLMLCIRVTDSGKGIKEEDQHALWDAFSRADEKNNRNIEGTGLGLALVHRLVLSMGGTVSVESTYGKGSCFIVEIPQEILEKTLVNEVQKAVKPVASRDANEALFTASKARVLVVDDTQMNLMVIKGLLKRTKVMVDLVESGAACLETLTQNHYDVIFLDHLMPVMDGEETLNHIKEDKLAENTPIVALTANAIGGARERYLNMGFDDYLSKPVKPMDLEEMLKHYIPKEKMD